MSALAKLDARFQRLFGFPYISVTRESSMHDRFNYLSHIVRGLPGGPFRILDVGCGSGIALRYLARYAPGYVSGYLGIDMDTSRLKPRYADVEIPHDFKNVQLDDDWNFGEFDIVWCSEVIEHLIDDMGVFKKICRSVRPKGHVLVTMPSRLHLEEMGKIFPSLLDVAPRQDGGHVRVGYTVDELKNLSVGTKARLIRADAVIRSDLSYIKRLYFWPSKLRLLSNLINLTMRTKIDRFVEANGEPLPYENYLCIAGLYQRV